MGNLEYLTVDNLHILGFTTPLEIAVLNATTITDVTATRIMIFSKFLYVRRNFKRKATLFLMARQN